MLFSHDNNKIFVQNYTCAGGTTSTPLWQKIRLLVEHGQLASWQKNVMQYVLPMYFLRFSRVGTLERNCHIPDIFYNTVLVDRVCRHVAVKVQTVGPFDLHHSVLKKEI